MNMRNLMVGMDAEDLLVALDWAVKDGNTDRVGYIDEWVHELYAEMQSYQACYGAADCKNEAFTSYRVKFVEKEGYEGVDYVNGLPAAMLCMLHAAEEVRAGKYRCAGLDAHSDGDGWYPCDNYEGGKG
jgi:hypothetical protein